MKKRYVLISEDTHALAKSLAQKTGQKLNVMLDRSIKDAIINKPEFFLPGKMHLKHICKKAG